MVCSTESESERWQSCQWRGRDAYARQDPPTPQVCRWPFAWRKAKSRRNWSSLLVLVHWYAREGEQCRCLNDAFGLKCWHAWQSFEENSTLEGILGELILPSVKRKEINLKEKGLMSLGLCCLIARVCTRHDSIHDHPLHYISREWH